VEREERHDSSELSYPPELYAGLHRGNPGDVDFYVRACSAAESVLELGCGYGRVLGPLSRAGHRVVGLDRDAALAELARQAVEPSGGRVVLGDMSAFDLGERFDRVIIPFNGLYCLLDPDTVTRCFERVCEHLAPGGLLIFDGWAADRFHMESDPTDLSEEHLEPVGTVGVHGRTYDVFERSRWDRATQRIDARYLHVERGGGAAIECALSQRYLRAAEATTLLERAGLEPLVLHGGFDQHAFDEESELLIVTAARAVDG
jgi:SAM-dependent methyltransferase